MDPLFQCIQIIRDCGLDAPYEYKFHHDHMAGGGDPIRCILRPVYRDHHHCRSATYDATCNRFPYLSTANSLPINNVPYKRSTFWKSVRFAHDNPPDNSSPYKL
mmetsp:Transcript_46438/g.88665  ORF Transcript_46438/g.88665 Transcript_46438/m.88665 type:complete len:104 (-) Transcript_46438:668-979(-)